MAVLIEVLAIEARGGRALGADALAERYGDVGGHAFRQSAPPQSAPMLYQATQQGRRPQLIQRHSTLANCTIGRLNGANEEAA